MISFEVNDMTCGHCVSTITKALKVVDNDAKVNIDLANHRVEIDASETDAAPLSDALTQEGDTTVAVDGASDRLCGSVVQARSW